MLRYMAGLLNCEVIETNDPKVMGNVVARHIARGEKLVLMSKDGKLIVDNRSIIGNIKLAKAGYKLI